MLSMRQQCANHDTRYTSASNQETTIPTTNHAQSASRRHTHTEYYDARDRGVATKIHRIIPLTNNQTAMSCQSCINRHTPDLPGRPYKQAGRQTGAGIRSQLGTTPVFLVPTACKRITCTSARRFFDPLAVKYHPVQSTAREYQHSMH